MDKLHWSERVKEGIKGSIDLITRYPGILGFTAGTATSVFTGSATMAAAASVASPTAALAVGGVTAVLTGYGIAGPVMAKAAEWQKIRDLQKNGVGELPLGTQAVAAGGKTSSFTQAAADRQDLNRAFSAVLDDDNDSPKGPS